MSKDPRHRVPGRAGSSFTRALAVTTFLLALGGATPALAQWRVQGIPFDSTATGQNSLHAVTDGRHGFIAAWIDTLSGVPAIRCQRVDSTGSVRWTPGGVLVRANARGLSGLAMASDGRNGALLAWVDSAAAGQARVRVQRVKPDSVLQWVVDGLVVDTTATDTLQGTPAVDSDGLGGAVVAWVDGRAVGGDPNDNDEIYVQRVDSTGVRLWTDGGVRTRDDGGDDDNSLPRVLGDGAGGGWVSWQDPAPSARVFVQRFDASGVAQWVGGGGPLDPSVSTPNGTSDLLMARGQGSSLMLAWFATGGGGAIRGATLSSSGALSTPGDLLGSWNFPPRSLVGRGASAFYLVSASGTEVRGIAVTSAGVASGSPLTIATEPLLDASSNVSAVPDGDGGVYVTWASAGVARARHLVAAGTSDWGPTPLTSGITPAQAYPVPVAGGDLLVAWVDDRNAATTGPDLYAQRVAPNGVTGTYFRILATVAAGNGAFSTGGGRTWVREGDSLRVRFMGTGGHRVSQTVVGATNLGPVPNYTFHDVTADSTLQASFSNAAATTQVTAVASAYRAFSIPFTLSNPAVSSAFANLMPYDPVRWRLGHWEADDSTYLEPSGALASIVPGAGYWFIGLKDTTLSFSGTPVAEAQFNLPMLGGPVSGRGWTQFGSPFRFPVAVSQLRLSLGADVPITDPGNTFTDPQVLEWNPSTSTYGAVSVLLPDRAYWLWRQSAAALTLRFPFEWNPVATGGLAPSLATLGDWAVGVTARSGEREAHVTFGAAPVAPGRWNRLSTHALPGGPGDALSLVARVSDWGEDNGEYASVFRPDAAALAWEFDASAAGGLAEATLSFAFTNLPADRRVVVSEPATGWSRDVTADVSVPLVLSAIPRRLRLEVLSGGPVAPDAPLATALRAAGPNPFRESATLSFSLARGGPLRWDVFDLAGRRVVSGTRTLDAGEHALTWDGRDEAGRRVEPGLYLLRWQADGRSGTARLVRTD